MFLAAQRLSALAFKMIVRFSLFLFFVLLIFFTVIMPAFALLSTATTKGTVNVVDNEGLSAKATSEISPELLQRAQTFLIPAKGWSLRDDGKVDFDPTICNVEKLEDGSEIYLSKEAKKEAHSPSQKRVVLRDGKVVSSVSAFVLSELKKNRTANAEPSEQSSSVIFLKGDLFGITQCHDE